MPIYTVYVGDYFIKSFKDVYAAKSVKDSLISFVESEKLPYKVTITCEVF